MRAILQLLAISLSAFGCQSHTCPPVVIEDNTPIVGANGSTTEALGIETLGGVFTPLINAGTAVPCSFWEIFSTASDGQTQIAVAPFRGTNHLAAANHALGRFQVIGIPSAPRGTPQVQITFAITYRQILVSARDMTRDTDLQIQRVTGQANP